ncbi:MAG: DUF1523 family protein [Paracoccaceae bacterium]
MRYLKWSFWAFLVLILFSFFHYTLPQHDIVRVTSTEIIRLDFNTFNRIFYAQADSGNVDGQNRDVRLINTFQTNKKVMVYRNEDTGFGWPPYFKVDSSNLQTEAQDLISDRSSPQWVSITHYGWRNEFLSIYPNAISVKTVSGPDVRIIPWANIIILLTLAVVLFMLRRMWLQFRERSIDPVLEDVGDATDVARSHATGIWGRLTGWIATWRSKPKR